MCKVVKVSHVYHVYCVYARVNVGMESYIQALYANELKDHDHCCCRTVTEVKDTSGSVIL